MWARARARPGAGARRRLPRRPPRRIRTAAAASGPWPFVIAAATWLRPARPGLSSPLGPVGQEGEAAPEHEAAPRPDRSHGELVARPASLRCRLGGAAEEVQRDRADLDATVPGLEGMGQLVDEDGREEQGGADHGHD